MTHILEAVAAVTGTRDRDVMDVSIVQVLEDSLALSSVRLYRVTHEGDHRQILPPPPRRNDSASRAAFEADLDIAWEATEAAAVRQTCLESGKITRVSGAGGHLTLFPLTGETGIVGIVEVETPLPLVEQAERLVDGMLRIYRNHLEAIEYGERDTLTGLLNRKTFEDSFARILSLRRDLQPAATGRWLGVLDIDHFKSINDRFGHLIGDEVLILLARLLRESFRATDRLYRFGGEEFVILLDHAAAGDAAKAFERFRARVEGHPFPQVERVTVSIGFTEIVHGDTSAAAFARADQAVYFAKQHGRNQANAYERLLGIGAVELLQQRSGDIELF